MSKGGVLLRAGTTLVRTLQFAIAAMTLSIFSSFLAYNTKHHLSIPRWEKAVEGMAGAAVIYTAFAVILTCFLGGITFFAFLAIILDLLFLGCFVAIAILTRRGAHSCGRTNPSPVGIGHHNSCQLERVVFAVAIAAALLFLVSAIMQVLLSRHHKKEKRFGPGPSNDYTAGTGKKQPFWKRKNKTTRDAELGVVGAGALAAEEKHPKKRGNFLRPSHETAATGSTAVGTDITYGGPNNKYAQDSVPTHNTGYIPPTGTGVPPTGTGLGGSTTRPDVVVHDANPYAEVHHGGFVHSHSPS